MKATTLAGQILTGCCTGFIFASLAGCFTPDTCTQGDNMSNPRLVDGLEQNDSGFYVRIQWDTGTGRGSELPDAYFADIFNVGPLDSPLFAENEQIASVELSDERELTVRFAEVVDSMLLAELSELSFSLVFNDRRSVIQCTHPGSTDFYLLDAVLTLDEKGELVDARFEQRIFFGAI